MTAPPHVRITRDTCSPLWAIRCAAPCTKLCAAVGRVCWLGSSLTQDGATEYARRLGYEVVA